MSEIKDTNGSKLNKSYRYSVVFFHKNIDKIYKKRWIEKCVKSILNQTFNDFSIYEINYGGVDYSIFSEFDFTNEHHFFKMEMPNHAEAMNFIIDKAFGDGCEIVFNTNLDDYYSPLRIEKQIEKIEQGYDLVSSDFCYIEEINGEDVVTFFKNIKSYGDISVNLNIGHNVIAHPCVAYSKKFWENNRYIPEEIPNEDLLLWKRSINKGTRFEILSDVLLYYRLHSNQVTGNNSSKHKP